MSVKLDVIMLISTYRPQCEPAAIAHLCAACEASVLLFDKSHVELASNAVNAAKVNNDDLSVLLLPWQSSAGITSIIQSARKQTPETHSMALRKPVEHDIAYIHHTSGTSTGLPKPIPQSHRAAVGVLACLKTGSRTATLTTTPLYHGGVADCFRAWTSEAMIWLFPGADMPITTRNIIKCFEVADQQYRETHTPAVAYFSSVPYVLQMLGNDPIGLSYLRRMALVGVGGAALPPSVGDILVSEGVNLVSRFGSAECGFLLSSDRQYTTDHAWQYLRPPSDSPYFLFEQQNDGSGLSELVITKGWPHMAKTNREDDSFATSDLFEPHETIERAWRYHSRSDSQLTLSTGKKFDPAPLEVAIASSSPLIKDVLVFGSGQQFPGALIFRSEVGAELDESKFVQSIWEMVQKINALGQNHTRITKGMLFVMEKETKGPEKSSKGTVLRQVAERRFTKEIENAYGGGPVLSHAEDDEVLGIVRQVVISALSHMDPLADDTDFYQYGVDSVKATQIRVELQKKVTGGKTLPWNVVYDCGNITRLSNYLLDKRNGHASQPKDNIQEMLHLVEQYSSFSGSNLETEEWDGKVSESGQGSTPRVVLLTGATGALGAHILSQLRTDKSVEQIVCLVRASSPESATKRVSESLVQRGKPPLKPRNNLDKDYITCLPAQLCDEKLGLSEEAYRDLRQKRLLVIHAAWAVNFSLPLRSFAQDHIAGLYNIISLSPARMVFCSSTASVLGLSHPSNIEEQISSDPHDADTLGYSRSKWVAEAICSRAYEKTSMKGRIKVLRIGQLTGDNDRGIWNMAEAWPLLLSTVDVLGCLPNLQHEPLSWLALDVAATAIIQIAMENVAIDSDTAKVPVYHIVNNDTSATWQDLLRWLKEIRSEPFEIVDPRIWLEKLEALHDHPAKGLLGLWKKAYGIQPEEHREPSEKGLQFAVKRTEAVAPAIRTVEPIDIGHFKLIWEWLQAQRKAAERIRSIVNG